MLKIKVKSDIAKHYELVINEIDVECETCLLKSKNDNERNSLNSVRSKFLTEINRIKCLNLELLNQNSEQPQTDYYEEVFREKFCFFIPKKLKNKDKSLDSFDSLDSFGILIVTNQYVPASVICDLKKYFNDRVNNFHHLDDSSMTSKVTKFLRIRIF